jgi:hypothetical protein
MPSKKYFIVQKETDQNGGVIYAKVINGSPVILGAPIIKSTTLNPTTVAVVTVSSTSPKYEYEIKLPYNIVRPFINDLYEYKYYSCPSNVKPMSQTIIRPARSIELSPCMSQQYRGLSMGPSAVAVTTASPTYSIQNTKMMLPSKYGYPYSEVKDVKVMVQTPQFTRTIYLGHANLLRVFSRIYRYYNIQPVVVNKTTGITVGMPVVLSNLEGLLRNVIDEQDYNEIYTPLQLPNVS